MVIILIQKHCFSYTVLYGWISYIGTYNLYISLTLAQHIDCKKNTL